MAETRAFESGRTFRAIWTPLFGATLLAVASSACSSSEGASDDIFGDGGADGPEAGGTNEDSSAGDAGSHSDSGPGADASGKTDGAGNGDGSGNADGTGGPNDGSTEPDAGPPPPCTTTSACMGGLVCNLATGKCEADLPCGDGGDCGPAAHCDTGGICVPSVTGSQCEKDVECAEGEKCIAGRCGCDGESYEAEKVPPNILIVLDRSSSMNDDLGGGQTKWEVAKDAINTLVGTYGTQVRFGLYLYPGYDLTCGTGATCSNGFMAVDVGSPTSDMDTAVGGAQTCSYGTPTAEALTDIVGYAGLADTTRENYILLITDGQSTCADPVPVVTTIRGQKPEVQTFVVGFGSGVDATELDGMATEGGTALASGPPNYYVATDAAALSTAFSTIAGSVLSCSYTLSSPPPDLGSLHVYFDDILVTRDTTHGDGWDYDSATTELTFSGPACDHLKSGAVKDLVIVHGCLATGDAGPPGGSDGGACIEIPLPCTTNAECCSGVCGGSSSPTCQESECRSFGASCATSGDCCDPLVCSKKVCTFELN